MSDATPGRQNGRASHGAVSVLNVILGALGGTLVGGIIGAFIAAQIGAVIGAVVGVLVFGAVVPLVVALFGFERMLAAIGGALVGGLIGGLMGAFAAAFAGAVIGAAVLAIVGACVGVRVGFEAVIQFYIYACGWSAILFVLAIFIFVFKEALPALRWLDLGEFLTSDKWRPDSESNPEFGIFALIVGTMCVTLGSTLLSVPLGLGAAVYLSEFCSGKVRETLKVVIELLAAIPSIVWGFIGVVVLGPIVIDMTTWLNDLGVFPRAYVGVNILNGSIILALMSVPVIVSVGEDALKAVPDSFREAALSLGASRWEVVYKVLFPAAKNGLLAAVLLGIGRAIGETMAVLLCTGHSVRIPRSVVDPVRTMTATIAAELGEAVDGGHHYQVLFLIGVVLFVLAFFVNLTADIVVKGVGGQGNG